MKKDKIEHKIILYVLVYSLIVSLVLLFVLDKNYTFSFMLGTATSLLGFTLTIKTVDKIIKYDDARKKSELIKSNLRNLFLYAIILVAAGFSYRYGADNKIHLDIITTAAGLLSVKLMIYFKEFIVDKFFKKQKNNEDDNLVEGDSNDVINN